MMDVMQADATFRYQLLNRLQSDCNYYLGAGGRSPKCLWAEDESKQIDAMKQLWTSFPANAKPEWLTWDEILQYESGMMEDKIFLKNVVSVDVDGLRGINTYTIKAQYDVKKEDSRGVRYEIEHELIDEFSMTWDEIEEDGGIAQVNKDLKECYNV